MGFLPLRCLAPVVMSQSSAGAEGISGLAAAQELIQGQLYDRLH
jgi:hypothetical protein